MRVLLAGGTAAAAETGTRNRAGAGHVRRASVASADGPVAALVPGLAGGNPPPPLAGRLEELGIALAAMAASFSSRLPAPYRRKSWVATG